MEIIEVYGNNVRGTKKAARTIKRGGVVVYPTDTLYGLGCDALNPTAIEHVFTLKKRAFSNPLSIAVNSIGMLERYAHLDERGRELLERFLPGALTAVLPKKDLPDILTSGKGAVAVRIPDSEAALALIEACGVPITATSANLSGERPPISVEEVLEQIQKADTVLDNGVLESREPSTIVDLTGEPKIIREGRIPNSELLKAFREIYHGRVVRNGR